MKFLFSITFAIGGGFIGPYLSQNMDIFGIFIDHLLKKYLLIRNLQKSYFQKNAFTNLLKNEAAMFSGLSSKRTQKQKFYTT